ncbi:hypothetical protein ACFL21_02715 [Patescibacteria group bacterium]
MGVLKNVGSDNLENPKTNVMEIATERGLRYFKIIDSEFGQPSESIDYRLFLDPKCTILAPEFDPENDTASNNDCHHQNTGKFPNASGFLTPAGGTIRPDTIKNTAEEIKAILNQDEEK